MPSAWLNARTVSAGYALHMAPYSSSSNVITRISCCINYLCMKSANAFKCSLPKCMFFNKHLSCALVTGCERCNNKNLIFRFANGIAQTSFTTIASRTSRNLGRIRSMSFRIRIYLVIKSIQFIHFMQKKCRKCAKTMFLCNLKGI